jgi:hypothetical protein
MNSQNSIVLLTTSLQSKTLSEIISRPSDQMMDSHMALISVATGLSIEKSLECVKIFKLKQQLEEADLMKIVIFIINC